MHKKQFIQIAKSAILFTLFSFFSLPVVFGQNTSLSVGAIPGTIDVSPTGAATYHIPIEVVPGIQGLQPNLAIVYNSRAEMGLLGIRWDLAGLSAITRVPQTLYHDENITAVNLTLNDRFSLDGNRLMVTNGTYGTAGSKYVTEMESFSEITAYETAGSGPKHFNVITEEGNIMEYGNTDDSRQMLGSNALSWYLNKITDPDGNCMIFKYAQSNGEIWITEIDYVQHASALTTPHARIVFTYQTGTQYHSDFIAGYEIKQTKLLQKVEVKFRLAGILLTRKSYSFSYSNDFPPKLVQIDFSAGTKSINPTVIEWGESTTGTYTKEDFSNSLFDLRATVSGHITGDFDGDGLCDIIEYSGGTIWILYRQTSPGVFAEACRGGLIAGIPVYNVMDEDEDGRAELLYTHRSQSVIQTNKIKYTGDGTFSDEIYSRIWIVNSALNGAMTGNFTGHDGGELLIWYNDNQVLIKGKYCDSIYTIKPGAITLLDFNGNGKTNIYVVSSGSYFIYEYNNATNGLEIIKSAPVSTLPIAPFVGDFNGDGISDLLWRVNGEHFRIALGTGNGFSNTMDVSLFHNSSTILPIICDINGDGKDDFIGISSVNGLYAYHYLCKGYLNGQIGFIPFSMPQTLVTSVEALKGYEFKIGDFNNDHKYDFLILRKDPNVHSIFYFQGGDPNYFTKQVTDGFGYTTKISYTPFYAFSFDYRTFKRRPVFCHLPQSVEVSNGIGNAFNRYEYMYDTPHFSYRRRMLLGFEYFLTTDLAANKGIYSYYERMPDKEILKPSFEQVSWAMSEVEKKVIYNSEILNLPNSFIQYNRKVTTLDLLANSKQEVVTRLRSDGRIDSLNTTIYENATSYTYLIKEKKKFQYLPVTLPNGIIRPRLLSEETSLLMYPSLNSPLYTKNYTYAGGRVSNITETNADGSISTSYSNYNSFGLPQTKTVSANGCTSRTETTLYEATGRFPASFTNAMNQTSTFTYHAANGKPLTITDINNLTTTCSYDAFERPEYVILPDRRKRTMEYKWNTTGSMENSKYCILTKEAGRPDTVVYYDMLNRELYRGVKGYWTETRYDNTGRITHLSLPYTSASNRIWKNAYTYDGHDRVISETAPYISLSYQYTPGSITINDLLRGISSSRSYDAAGRIVSTTDSGGTVRYNYLYVTDNGKIRELTTINLNGSITSVMNDLWGNRLKLIDPDAGTSTYTFNKFNELISQTDARGNTLTYQYDKLGRISLKGYTESGTPKTITYLYDTYTASNRGKGQLSAVTIDGVTSERYTYDTLGRVQQEYKIIDNITYNQSYTYDNTGQLATIAYPGGFAVRYEYDANGDLSAIKQNDNDALIYRASKRNSLGQVTRVTFGNGLASAYYFNDYGTTTGITTGNKVFVETPPVIIKPFGQEYPEETEGDSVEVLPVVLAGLPSTEQDYITDNSVQYLSYTYNNYGLMTLRKDVKHNQCEQFTYDKLDRLTSHTAGACSGSFAPQYYGYDNTGNITFSPYVGDYAYDSGNNKPHAVNSISLRPEYPKAIAASECCVLYDAFNMPVSITEGINRMNIFYNAARERCKTSFTAGSGRGAPSKTKYFISSLFEKEKGTSPNFERELSYIYAGNRLIAIFVKNNGTSEQKMYYIHQDHLGSYDVITTDNKAVSERHHFDPWGNRKNPTNWLATDTRTSFLFDRGFTGHEHLDAFKIINMNARLYDPVIGRFFSPDPYVQAPELSQAFNRYSYCLNNPLKYTDPSGESWLYGDNPIFDYNGEILGTDDLGPEGEAIIMERSKFTQGMPHNMAEFVGVYFHELSYTRNIHTIMAVQDKLNKGIRSSVKSTKTSSSTNATSSSSGVRVASSVATVTSVAAGTMASVLKESKNFINTVKADADAANLGLDFTKEIGKVAKYGNYVKWIGWAGTAVSVISTEYQYRQREISQFERVIDHVSSTISLIPVAGTAWTIGYNLGKNYGISTWFK